MLSLSIIIPFYNVEKHISQCLNSVVNQDLPLSEYEIICVNDASPDHSRDIVLEYMKQYPNIRLIEHEQNKKLGAARNTGRSIARGKYIWNVDSDDYIKPNCLYSLVEICEKDNLDILMFNFYHTNKDGEKANDNRNSIITDCCSGADFIIRNSSMIGEFSPVWTQIYRKEFLDNNNIFSPQINAGEDVPFSYQALYLAKRIKYINQFCYYYRLNNSSIGGDIEYKLSSTLLYEKCIACPRYMSEIVDNVIIDSPIKKIYASIVKYTIHWLPDYWPRLNKSEKNTFKKMCRKNIWKDKLIFKYIGKKAAIKQIIYVFNPF